MHCCNVYGDSKTFTFEDEHDAMGSYRDGLQFFVCIVLNLKLSRLEPLQRESQ